MLLVIYGFAMVIPSPLFFADYQGPNRYAYLISVQACPTLMILGASIAGEMMGARARESVDRFFSGPILTPTPGQSAAMETTYWCLLGLSIATFAGVVSTMEYVPLFVALKGHAEYVSSDDIRYSVYTMPLAVQWLHALNLRLLLPFCVLYKYIMKSIGRATATGFYLTLLWAMFCSFLTFERQMPLAICGLLVMASLVIGGRSKMLQTGIFLLGGLTAGGVLSFLQYNKEVTDVSGAVQQFTVMRLWINPAWFASVMFQDFGEGTFLFGKTIRLVGLFSDSYRDITSIGFLADMWVNFGWVGVIVGPIVYGFFFQWIQLRYFGTRTVSNVIVYMIFGINAMWLVYTNMLLTMAVSVFGIGVTYFTLAQRHSANVPGRKASQVLATLR